ncbi:hypothetical protein LTR95_012745 [Oleoguttula sp. CCFEE 5521]
MHLSTSTLAVVALASQVQAHGYVNLFKTGGKFYRGFDLLDYYTTTPPAVPGWSTTALDSGFVMPDSYQTSDIICHKGSKPGKTHLPVVAGQTVQLFWNTWPAGHKGPVIDYLAPCANNNCTSVTKESLVFSKLDQVGLKSGPAPGTWGTDTLVSSNNSWTTTIPSTLKPGAYVLRHEIISLHAARSDNGAQNYPQCVNLMVSGSGSKTVSGGIAATSFYKRTDPGVLIDIYNNLNNYTVPGPAVQAF